MVCEHNPFQVYHELQKKLTKIKSVKVISSSFVRLFN